MFLPSTFLPSRVLPFAQPSDPYLALLCLFVLGLNRRCHLYLSLLVPGDPLRFCQQVFGGSSAHSLSRPGWRPTLVVQVGFAACGNDYGSHGRMLCRTVDAHNTSMSNSSSSFSPLASLFILSFFPLVSSFSLFFFIQQRLRPPVTNDHQIIPPESSSLPLSNPQRLQLLSSSITRSMSLLKNMFGGVQENVKSFKWQFPSNLVPVSYF
ncbi:hypothetical protein DVH24_005981 [Malus domestica]|uniref:Transmembrane protein n=1 Tax=Malus domestica TaxID=3750 RepID=A0A498IJI5_MALDO|nr:hypothetical protein DVH24_005981 [Malus domestica]